MVLVAALLIWIGMKLRPEYIYVGDVIEEFNSTIPSDWVPYVEPLTVGDLSAFCRDRDVRVMVMAGKFPKGTKLFGDWKYSKEPSAAILPHVALTLRVPKGRILSFAIRRGVLHSRELHSKPTANVAPPQTQ